MPKLFKLTLSFLLLLFFLTPVFVLAGDNITPDSNQGNDEIFKAKVIKILQEKKDIGDNNITTYQQNIYLINL